MVLFPLLRQFQCTTGGIGLTDPPFPGKLANPGPVTGPGGLIHVSVNSCRIFSEDLLHCACLFQNGSIMGGGQCAQSREAFPYRFRQRSLLLFSP